MHTFDQRLTTIDFSCLYIVYLETDEEIFEKNLISSHWKKFASLKEKYDRDGIRTHARRPYWFGSPTPLQLGHHVCQAVEVRNIIPFTFLISVDSNRPVEAHFWSEIDYCWFFSYLDCLFGNWWKTFLTEKLISRLWTNFFVNWKMDRDRIRAHARRLSFLFDSVFNRFYFHFTLRCTLLITDWLLLIFFLSW